MQKKQQPIKQAYFHLQKPTAVFLTLLLFSFFTTRAQSLLFPSDYFMELPRQRQLMQDTLKIPVHGGLQPFEYSGDDRRDSLLYYKADRVNWKNRWCYHNLIKLKVDDTLDGNVRHFELSIDPVFNFQGGRDLNDSFPEKIYTNSRGIILKAAINRQLKFETAFFENQSSFPGYIDHYIDQTQVIPGQGRFKNFKTHAYDYAFSSGVLSYRLCSSFNIQLGQGKLKVGNGYRSLLLSDNTFNYPFVRLNSSFFKERMQYSLIYASLINPYQGTQTTYSEKLLQKKAASFQFLSWQVVPSFTVSFFQGLVWQPADEKNRQHVDAAFFSPIIYTQAALYGLNHQKNNIVLGTNFNWKMNSSIVLYSQLMLDNIKHGKSSDTDAGIQTGVKYFDAFGVSNLFLQAEYNRQNNRPYQTSTGNNYTHYGQQLAYPLSAYCGNEAVFIVSWQHKRFFINGKSNYFVSDNQQTYKRSVLFNDGRFGYLIHPKTNMNIAMGINWRTEVINNRIYNIDEKNNTRFFYLSLKTSLYNVYWDF